MRLLDRTGYRPDPFQRSLEGETTAIQKVLVPFDELADALRLREYGQQIGVDVGNATKIEALLPHLGGLALIAIAFPSFSDGRGFSLARRLRRAGFTGTLRAVGPLIADQFPYAVACGFDEVELPAPSALRQPADQWRRARDAITLGYQRGLNREGSILDQRRNARVEHFRAAE